MWREREGATLYNCIMIRIYSRIYCLGFMITNLKCIVIVGLVWWTAKCRKHARNSFGRKIMTIMLCSRHKSTILDWYGEAQKKKPVECMHTWGERASIRANAAQLKSFTIFIQCTLWKFICMACCCPVRFACKPLLSLSLCPGSRA